VIQADKGTLAVGGLDPTVSGRAIRQMSGVVTEGAGLYPDMSAAENLLFFAELYGVRRKRERAGELLEQFGLAAHADKPAGTFSTGMKKRLALAKALLHEPELLFLDEPTNGLDPEGIREVIASIKALNASSG